MYIPPPKKTNPISMFNIVQRLKKYGFFEQNCSKKLGLTHISNVVNISSLQKEAFIKKVSDKFDALDVLISLFLLDECISFNKLEKYFRSKEISDLEAMHLITINGAKVLSSINLLPCKNVYIATDKHHINKSINQVMFLYAETYYLSNLLIKRKGDSVLDLCTGSGVLAILSSRYFKKVIGVDNNPRAIAFANFNKAVNNIKNIEFLQGDLYEPISQNDRFDLIISNPPHSPVISSKAGDNFYSGGRSGEKILSRVISSLDHYLSPGGYSQIVTLIIYRKGETLKKKIRNWLGVNSNNFNIIVLASKDPYHTNDKSLKIDWEKQKIKKFEFGVINIKKEISKNKCFYIKGPSLIPRNFPIDKAFRIIFKTLPKNRTKKLKQYINFVTDKAGHKFIHLPRS